MTAYVVIIFHLETVWLLSQKTVNAARSEAGWARFDPLYSGPILGPALQIQSGSSGNRKSTLAQPKVPVEKPHWGHHQGSFPGAPSRVTDNIIQPFSPAE